LLVSTVEHRHAVAATDKWKRAAGGEPVEERLCPDVLMNVDLHGAPRTKEG
jgi:hypothetical protein